MNPYVLNFFRFFPIFSFIISSWVCYAVVSIVDDMIPSFIFLSFQFYVNWLIVVLENNPWAKNSDTQVDLIGHNKLWFCTRCNKSGADNVEHCPLCKRCVTLRDHHCYFLGTCINHMNARHFMVTLFYTVLICPYVLMILFPYMYNEFQKYGELSTWDLTTKFFYPVMLGRWLSGKEELYLLSLSAMFDMLISIGLSALVYYVYQMNRVLTGAIFAKYHISPGPRSKNTNFRTVFGKWGLLNILLPIPISENELFIYFKQPKYQN